MNIVRHAIPMKRERFMRSMAPVDEVAGIQETLGTTMIGMTGYASLCDEFSNRKTDKDPMSCVVYILRCLNG